MLEMNLSGLGRRPLIASAAALGVFGAGWQLAEAKGAAEGVALWPGTPPGGGGPQGPLRKTHNGAVDHIATPCLLVYRPDKPNGSAVLVAGGGGYTHINLGTEAEPAALWLAARGITAFVLIYRLPREGWEDANRVALQDAQRAVRLIRAKAGQYGVRPERVSVLGFSAGGHLMGLTADWSEFHSYAPVDSVDFLSARPEAAALIYPVITLEPPYQHSSTRVQMVGKDPDPRLSAEWSVQTHVRPGCPAMFLVQAKDDPISNPANTLILEQACHRAGVKVELHRLPAGGHGFGMGVAGTVTAEWPSWYAKWLVRQGMLTA